MKLGLPKRSKTVRCLDCGYLHTTQHVTRIAGVSSTFSGAGHPVYDTSAEISEILPEERTEDSVATLHVNLACYRHALERIKEPPEPAKDLQPAEREALRTANYQERYREAARVAGRSRKCAWFYEYIPSHLPADHLALQERADDRRQHMKGYVISAAIGGLIAGLFSVIAILLTNPSGGSP